MGLSMSASKKPMPLQISKDFEIPSIPLVLIKIIQTLNENSGSAKELEDLILHDPALSARILRLANSAFYSFHTRVKTISHAIALLGLNLVTSLAIGINIFDTFTSGAKSEGALINKLWIHSCGVGVLAKEIWIQRGNRGKEGEFAFLCGLLHDVGKIVLFKTYPEHYGSIFAIEKSEEDPCISSYEDEYYGSNHAAIGEILAKNWGFPSELAYVIRRHHDPSATEMPLLRAIMMADLLAKELKIGYDGDHSLNEDRGKIQSRLEFTDEEYAHMTDYAARERKNIERFFKISS
jgi:HD-like signal output (HDOD) protein